MPWKGSMEHQPLSDSVLVCMCVGDTWGGQPQLSFHIFAYVEEYYFNYVKVTFLYVVKYVLLCLPEALSCFWFWFVRQSLTSLTPSTLVWLASDPQGSTCLPPHC